MKQKPRITPVEDRRAIKATILAHAKQIPPRFQKYFTRPRWDAQRLLLRGSDGWAIGWIQRVATHGRGRWGYRPQRPATILYQLTTDRGDRDISHIVVQRIPQEAP